MNECDLHIVCACLCIGCAIACDYCECTLKYHRIHLNVSLFYRRFFVSIWIINNKKLNVHINSWGFLFLLRYDWKKAVSHECVAVCDVCVDFLVKGSIRIWPINLFGMRPHSIDKTSRQLSSPLTIELVILIWGWTFANNVVANLAIRLATMIGYHRFQFQHQSDSPIRADWFVSLFDDDCRTIHEPPPFPYTNDRLAWIFLHLLALDLHGILFPKHRAPTFQSMCASCVVDQSFQALSMDCSECSYQICYNYKNHLLLFINFVALIWLFFCYQE